MFQCLYLEDHRRRTAEKDDRSGCFRDRLALRNTRGQDTSKEPDLSAGAARSIYMEMIFRSHGRQ